MQTKECLKHGSLFSGIGGFDLAAEWIGWENVFHCEWEEFPQKVLKYYWPKAISYGDIKQTDFTVHRGEIDILTGGFPCQPYSSAGKRKGKEDDRHLWPEMLRAIREIKPTYVVGENVSGLLSWNGGLVFEEVQADLEAEGYEVQPILLPACGVGAPHRRDRIWFVAHSTSYGSYRTSSESRKKVKGQNRQQNEQPSIGSEIYTPSSANTRGEQLQEWTPKRNEQDKKEEGGGLDNRTKRSSNFGNAPNSSLSGLQGRKLNGTFDKEDKKRRQQSPRSATERHKITDWEKWPTQSPICSGDDGIPRELDGISFPKWRNESIKAYGNAIVPQVAFQIFKAIHETL